MNNELLLGRQPVLDQHQKLVGYELMLQLEAGDKTPPTYNPSRAAMLICAAYAELGIRSALGRNIAFLRFDPMFFHEDAIEAMPPDAVILELALETAPDAQTLARCRALRERDYSLALANYAGLDERSMPLLNMLDVIKIDIREHDENKLRELAGPLAKLPLKLLAQGVETQEAMELSKKVGFELFQGYYFARPEIVSGRRLMASQISLIQLINLVSRDLDTAKIEDGFKHEPALAANLLRIVNSVGYGLNRRISSLRHAISLLGRRQLQRWLQLLLMTPAEETPDPSSSPLLQVAALRGRMMELLLRHSYPRNGTLADQAFITGIMSMMPTALGLPMHEIFEQIALETSVMEALTSHAGVLGKTLALLECFDADDSQGCMHMLDQLPEAGLSLGTLNSCLVESLRWVNGSTEDR